MGGFLSRPNSHAEEVACQASIAYRYPPANGGNYFANHFIMGGEKFDSPQPESFLFGENNDLNFLGGRPTPFPYPPPQANEPTKTLRALVNIRRDSLHFVSLPWPQDSPNAELNNQTEDTAETSEEAAKKRRSYHIQFTFDSDVKCAITIHYFCTEEISPQGVVYSPRQPGMHSDTFYYKRGANQVFNQPSHVFQPGMHPEAWLTFGDQPGYVPMAIQCLSLEGEAPRQCHTTYGLIERASDGGFILKAHKQKLFLDGLGYLLQEVYGLENRSNESHAAQYDDDNEDDDCGADCVVCMCDLRDTIILPCRHLCLCFSCAESLRYQANNCPICRAPFIALLQIRAVQKINHAAHPALAGSEPVAQEGVPQGYIAVSLVEALNGPSQHEQQRAQGSATSTNPAPTAASAVLSSSLASLPGEAEARPSSSSSGQKKSRHHRRKGSAQEAAATGPAASDQSGKVESETSIGGIKVELKIVDETAAAVVACSPLDIVDEELANMDTKGFEPHGKGADVQRTEDLEQDDEEAIATGAAAILAADASVALSSIESSIQPCVLATPHTSSSIPGTPISGASIHSSQDSSSASSTNSTKQLLPQIEVVDNEGCKSSPGTVTFTPSATIVRVVPKEKHGDMC